MAYHLWRTLVGVYRYRDQIICFLGPLQQGELDKMSIVLDVISVTHLGITERDQQAVQFIPQRRYCLHTAHASHDTVQFMLPHKIELGHGRNRGLFCSGLENEYIAGFNLITRITFAILTKPSPCLSIDVSPSTASMSFRVFPRRSRSSIFRPDTSASSSLTSKIRKMFSRATTTLHRTLAASSCRAETVECVNLRLHTYSTPLGGWISW